jgi:hypothetical protein
MMAMPNGADSGSDAPVAASCPGAGGAAGAETAVHCANRVLLVVVGLAKSNRAPALCAVDHPARVKPARVGVTGAGTARSEHAIARETALPPAESEVCLRLTCS